MQCLFASVYSAVSFFLYANECSMNRRWDVVPANRLFLLFIAQNCVLANLAVVQPISCIFHAPQVGHKNKMLLLIICNKTEASKYSTHKDITHWERCINTSIKSNSIQFKMQCIVSALMVHFRNKWKENVRHTQDKTILIVFRSGV